MKQRTQPPTCSTCQTSFALARAELGYTTCLQCGEAEAARESDRRRTCLAPAYNKGAYQYITDPSQVVGIHRKGG